MATESVKILIEAEDKATAKIKSAILEQEKAAERSVLASQKQTKEGLKATKATTDFFGAVAGMAGGSQVASVASQLAGLTEKTGQFSEVAKAGGSSADRKSVV